MERDWIIELKEELKREKEVSSDGNWKKTSIYKVPVHAAKLNKRAYSPWVAAIGPYHRGEAQLHRMEDDKKRALRRFLHRAEHKAPEEYVEALDKVVGDLRVAYAHLDHDLKQDEKGFLLLMITDGCFVLETMLADHESPGNAAADDLIFSDHGRRNVIPCIKRDMLLIENQVPLLLLETLVAVNQDLSIQESEKRLRECILEFYGKSKKANVGKCRHILDMYRQSMTGSLERHQDCTTTDEVPTTNLKPQTDNYVGGIVHSATELKEAGINFQKGSSKLTDIKWIKGHRTLRLPTIDMDDTSESKFMNMVAYERLHIGAGNEISSYIYFMNGLVRDERDVRLLKREGIITSVMSSDKDVAKLFLKLSNELLFESDTWLAISKAHGQ